MTDARSGPACAGRRRAMLAGLGLAVAACGGPGSRRPDGSEDARRFAERGYVPAAAGEPQPFADTWVRGERVLVAEGLVPVGPDAAPLVLYLPGLGEGTQAGIAWRQAWAAAGYAVVSLQEQADHRVWTSPPARAGEFRRLVADRFDPRAVAERVEDVRHALDRLRARARTGAIPFARIDPDRVAVAGFDVGARTAMALAGERHPVLGILPRPAPVQAIVAISPVANAAAGGLAERFGAVSLPLLVVTGTGDEDPYGIVDTPFARQAPFHFAPPGDKFLLVLADGIHATLSGSPPSALPDAGDAGAGRGPGRGFDGPPSGSASRFGDSPGGGGNGPGQGGGPGRGRRGGMGGPPGADGPSRSGEGGTRRQVIAVERLSTAFLDGALRRDPVAREWLSLDAGRWLAGTAALSRR